jgi:hypothetical protein
VISYQNNNLKPTLVHYIYHKNRKGKPCKKDSSILKNDIPNNLEPQKPVIYSRNMKFSPKNWDG